MKRFSPAMMLAALIGAVAAMPGAIAAPPDAVPIPPVKTTYFMANENETTALYRKRYQMLRAALPPETRHAVIALLPDVVDMLRVTQYQYIPQDTYEKRLHTVIQKRFRRTAPVVQDILTIYTLLEITLPDSNFATAFLADFDLQGDWHDTKHQQFGFLSSNMGGGINRPTQLIADLMAATSDVPTSLIRGIR